MNVADPGEIFRGNLVFTAPHMDDEILACGGTIARLPDKDRMHVIYATDGSKSPVPMFRWMGAPSADLPDIRKAEARAALDVLGIPQRNIHFLGYPDGALRTYIPALCRSLADVFERLQPAHLFIPFRYDRHPDHLALHEAALTILPSLNRLPQVVEYFVYYRWRLLPGGDVRRFIRSEHLLHVDIRQQSDQKRRALECYTSQTTRYFPWQDRPILPPERLAEVSRTPEIFLLQDPDVPGTTIFSRLRRWIPLVHWLEPSLKKRKEQIRRLMRRRAKSHARAE